MQPRPLKAVFLNCSLKRRPHASHTEALIEKIIGLYDEEDVRCEVLRLADFDIPFGMSFDMSDELGHDDWPGIWEKLDTADIIIVATPIWMGHRSSIAQLLMERLDATSAEKTEEATGQYALYNKVAGCVVTGNEDGAHSCAETILFNMTHFGATVPPNADCYWVGDAGKGNSYRDANGEYSTYVNRTARLMVRNTAQMARMLKERPFETDLNRIEKEVEASSDTDFEIVYQAPQGSAGASRREVARRQ